MNTMKKLLALLLAVSCLSALALSSLAEAPAEGTARVRGVTLQRLADPPEDTAELLADTSVLTRMKRSDDAGNAIYLGKNPTRLYALADLSGNLLTEYAYFGGMRTKYGLIQADEIRGEETLTAGALTQAGQVVVPFQYFACELLGNRWAVGFYTEEVTEDQDYDYYSIFTEEKHYYTITQADIYHFDGTEGKLVATVDRQGFGEAQGKGDYLNLIAREEDGKYYYNAAITYDAGFNPVWTEAHAVSDFSGVIPAPVAAYYDDDARLYGLKDADGNVVLEPTMDYIASTVYDGVEFKQDDKCGLIDLNGNVVLPAQFGELNATSAGPMSEDGESVTRYNSLGYFIVGDENYEKGGYAVAGGEITCPLEQNLYSMNYGVAVAVENEDGTRTLVAADGVKTELGEAYTYVSHVSHSSGMLWTATRSEGGGYDLLDWHGQALLSGYSDLTLTADGTVLAAKPQEGPLELYGVNYQFE